MNIRSRYCTHTLVIAAVLIAAQVTAQDAPNDLGLRLDVSLPSPTIAVYEPLRLCISATVTSDAFQGHLVPWGVGRSGLVITGPTGERKMSDRDLRDPVEAPGDWLPATKPPKYARGYVDGVDVWLFYDMKRSEYVFPTPGKYHVRVWVPVFSGSNLHSYKIVTLESEVVVEVVDTKYPWAQRLWLYPQAAGVLQYHGNPLEPLTSREMVNDYSPYAAYTLSTDRKRPVADRLSLLQRVVDGSPPYQLRDLALLDLAELAIQQKDYALAEQSANRVLQVSSAPPWRKTQAQKVLEQAQWYMRPK